MPITTLSEEEIDQIESETGQQLLWYAYRGIYTFKKICKLHPDKKENDILAFYLSAVKKGVVFIVDMINMNNVYVLTR